MLTDAASPAAACGRFVTAHFVETAYGGEQNCIETHRSQSLAHDIAVGPGGGDANTATHLVVVPKGGPYDGAKVEVKLVVTGGTYRVDGLTAHVPPGP